MNCKNCGKDIGALYNITRKEFCCKQCEDIYYKTECSHLEGLPNELKQVFDRFRNNPS